MLINQNIEGLNKKVIKILLVSAEQDAINLDYCCSNQPVEEVTCSSLRKLNFAG